MLNRTIILAAVMTLALSGCSTVEGMGMDLENLFKGGSSQPSGEKINIGTSPDGQTWNDAAGKPGTAPTDKVDLSYNRLAGEFANNSVQLYSLDTPGQQVNRIDRRSAGTGTFGVTGMPSSTDPSVTVFPFSDDMYTPGVKPGFNGYGRRPSVETADLGGNLDSLPMYTGNPNTIYFQHGSSALNAAARQVIASVARSYNGPLLIEGHASRRTGTHDPVKSALVNLQMSMKRAMAVTKKLVQAGVPASSIKVSARGDTAPAVAETDRKAEAKNRRVEIHTGHR